MPIKKQAYKAMRRDAKRQVSNLRRKRSMKESIKEIRNLVEKGKAKDVGEQLSTAYKAIDKAQKQGIIKKNTAARKKSRLARALAK